MVLTQPVALALTLVTEAAVALLIAPRLGATRLRAAAAATAGSLVTHPLLWFAVLEFWWRLGDITVPLFEGVVVLVETLAYRLLATKSWRTALLFSIIANLASWGLGFVLQRFV